MTPDPEQLWDPAGASLMQPEQVEEFQTAETTARRLGNSIFLQRNILYFSVRKKMGYMQQDANIIS